MILHVPNFMRYYVFMVNGYIVFGTVTKRAADCFEFDARIRETPTGPNIGTLCVALFGSKAQTTKDFKDAIRGEIAGIRREQMLDRKVRIDFRLQS